MTHVFLYIALLHGKNRHVLKQKTTINRILILYIMILIYSHIKKNNQKNYKVKQVFTINIQIYFKIIII